MRRKRGPQIVPEINIAPTGEEPPQEGFSPMGLFKALEEKYVFVVPDDPRVTDAVVERLGAEGFNHVYFMYPSTTAALPLGPPMWAAIDSNRGRGAYGIINPRFWVSIRGMYDPDLWVAGFNYVNSFLHGAEQTYYA